MCSYFPGEGLLLPLMRIFHNVPPIPAPATIGGGHWDLHLLQLLNGFLTPSIPSAGFNAVDSAHVFTSESFPVLLFFFTLSPAVIFYMDMQIVLSLIFSRIKGSFYHGLLRKPSVSYPWRTPSLTASSKARPPDVRPGQSQKYHCHACILADWNHILHAISDSPWSCPSICLPRGDFSVHVLQASSPHPCLVTDGDFASYTFLLYFSDFLQH